MTHDGSSNFAIWFFDETSGERLDLLVNEIGSFGGRVAIEVPKDSTYLYEVSADGNWTIEALQPIPGNSEIINAPTQLTGAGRDVRYFVFMEDGLRRVQLNHDGMSNFAIWVFNSDASQRDLIVNEIGPYEGSSAIEVGDGIFQISDAGTGGVLAVFDITADGNWTIDIQ